jgi:hypothetical protein
MEGIKFSGKVINTIEKEETEDQKVARLEKDAAEKKKPKKEDEEGPTYIKVAVENRFDMQL